VSKYVEHDESELGWKAEKIKCHKEQISYEFTNRLIPARSERKFSTV
jgi:hypothetical protein